MDALLQFLSQLTRDAMEESTTVILNKEEIGHPGQVRVRTSHFSNLHRVYWHYGWLSGCRDWWSDREEV